LKEIRCIHVNAPFKWCTQNHYSIKTIRATEKGGGKRDDDPWAHILGGQLRLVETFFEDHAFLGGEEFSFLPKFGRKIGVLWAEDFVLKNWPRRCWTQSFFDNWLSAPLETITGVQYSHLQYCTNNIR